MMKVTQFTHKLGKGWSGLTEAKNFNSPQTLVLAFCAPKYADAPEVLRELSAAFPDSVVTGCSSAGEINGGQIDDASIAAIAIQFTGAKVRLVAEDFKPTNNSHSVGASLAQSLREPSLSGAMILSDGLVANGGSLIEGFNSEIDNTKVVVSGGLAGDGNLFQRTWVLHDGQPVSRRVVAIGLYGDSLIFGHGSKGDWDIFGHERTITRSKDNILYELDNQPALRLYKEYLGERAAELPASGLLFPLQIRKNSASENRLVRTILGVNEDDQSLIFAGNMPEGGLAQMMRANFERVIDAAGDAASMSKIISLAASGAFSGESMTNPTGTLQNAPLASCVIAISCVGRRLVLGGRAEEEVELLQQSFGKFAHIVGFYSYGELSPTAKGGACELHNQSMTLLSISEAA